MSTGPSVGAWLALAITFVLTLAGVVGLTRLWRQRWSPQARALRQRVQSLTGQTPAERGANLLIKPGASAVDTAWWAGLQAFPGYVRLENWLQRTRSERSPLAFLMMDLVLLVTAFLVAEVFLHLSTRVSVLLALACAAMPWLLQLRSDVRQRRQFEQQFPDALDYMSRALRSGQGLTSALSMVESEFSDPLGREFRITVDEINFGLDFSDAMRNLAQRVRSQDLDFFVVAIVIQRESGGNLAELLGGLANTVRERMKLAGKVRVISAEGRLSGVVLGCLPFLLGGLLTTLNPSYMNTLWQSESGMKVVTIALVLMAVGSLWLWKIVQVRV